MIYATILLVVAQGCAPPSSGALGLRLRTSLGTAVDTFAGTVTKDMVADPDTTVALSLTAQELSAIRHRAEEVRFFDLPDTIVRSAPPAAIYGPDPQLTLELRIGQKGKLVIERSRKARDLPPGANWSAWPRKGSREADAAERLSGLVDYILKVVAAHPEYKALPNPNSGYL